jgi:Fungal specific transcription factor domain
MWVGALFGMMCLAEHFSLITGDGPPGPPHTPQKMIQKYREKAAQCLILGNYAKAGDYVLEALVIYLATEQLRSNDIQFGLSILSGIVVRTAMRMGYQRDPSHYPKIPVLQAEMRRRLWSTIVISDILISYQVGLPKIINESQSDTELPRNLLDEDFDESTVELPHPRPDSECTLMAYAITKHKLTSVFGMIVELASSPWATSYTHDVMRLDKLLHEVHNSFPPGLSMRPTTSSITDSGALISRRFALETLFQKSRCVLHRRYLTLAKSEHQYLYSRQSCVDAAIQLLHHQFILHSECQPGGLLHRDSWKVAPLMNQGFLLAAMIICLEMDHMQNGTQNVTPVHEQAHADDMFGALQKSFIIWNEKAESSSEAQRASSVLRMMLEKFSPNLKAKGVAGEQPALPTLNNSKYTSKYLYDSRG